MTWILTASVGAGIGAVLGILLLLLLRFPRQPVRIGTFTWKNVLHLLLARHLTRSVTNWIDQSNIEQSIRTHLKNGKTREQVEIWLSAKADHYLSKVLPEKWPMLSMLIGEKTKEKVQVALLEQVRSDWSNNMDSLSHQHLSNKKLSAYLIQIGELEDTEKWSDRTWKWIKARMFVIVLILSATGSILSVASRLVTNFFLTN